MSIDVACSCGVVVSAEDGWAGKRIRCKACGDLVRVPDLIPKGSGATREQADARPAPAAAKPKAVRGPSWDHVMLSVFLTLIALYSAAWAVVAATRKDEPGGNGTGTAAICCTVALTGLAVLSRRD